MRFALLLLILVNFSAVAHADPMDDFLAHRRAGDRLAKAQSWDEAIGEYAQANAILNSDSSVWAGLGWAAFRAGYFEDSKRYSLIGIGYAKSHPPSMAAGLYNLGRLYEARGGELETTLALACYAHSLAVRPGNATVQAALDRLVLAFRQSSVDERQALVTAGACARSLAGAEPWLAGEDRGCEAHDVAGLPRGFHAVEVSERFPQIEDKSYYLVSGTGAHASAVAWLGHHYFDMRPGGGYISGLENFDVGAVRTIKVGGRRVLTLELAATSSSPAEDPEDEAEADPKAAGDAAPVSFDGTDPEADGVHTAVLYCLLDAPVSCPLRLPRRHQDKAGGKKSYELAHKPRPDGSLEVTAASGKAGAETRKQIGVHRLWPL